MSLPSVNLADTLKHYPLLLPAQLDEVVGKLQKQFPAPKGLAKELVRLGWLTHFQVNQLFQGKGQELLLGPYLLLERLGEGGMGQVFKARHRMLGRIVALKVVRKDKLSHPDVIRRFEREIKAASQLSHRNVVLAYDSDVVDGTHYFAMEYVDGIDFSRLVKTSGALPILKACDYIRQAALGLQHAHERGLVHRDIKPANLLLTQMPPPEGDVVKILDMGLARLTEAGEDTGLTQDGKVVGTPDYIAPEQARSASKVDIRGDIYSLGCTFYYLLTADIPFPGGTTVLEKLVKHQIDEPRPVEDLRAEVPEPVRAILKRLIQRKPEDRYQAPVELANALDAFLRSQTPKTNTRIDAQTIAITDSWFYTHLGRARGPVSTVQLRHLAATGDLYPDDRVWPKGLDPTRSVEASAVVEPTTFAHPGSGMPKWLADVHRAEQVATRSAKPAPAPAPAAQAAPAVPKWLGDVQQTEQKRTPPRKPDTKPAPDWLDDVR